MTRKPTRPLLRYHGGKWMIARWIISHFPEHRIYCEPYGGAASVLLQKPRAYSEVYNDLDCELVNLFRIARDRGPELSRALELTPYARTEYYSALEPAEDPLENARRLVVRSHLGFGSDSHNPARRSGFRQRSFQSHTSPSQAWRGLPAALDAIIERLRGVLLENRPAEEVLLLHDTPGTLFYCDPPYPHEARRIHQGLCYRYEMTEADHRRLAELLRALRGMVVLSGYDCPLYSGLFGDWRSVRRRSFADGARERIEVLWLSPNLPNQGLFKEADHA